MKEHSNEFNVENEVQKLRRERITQEIKADKSKLAESKSDDKDWANASEAEVRDFLASRGVYRR